MHIWRNLKRYGALSLKSGGHLLPNSPVNVEHFQWLAVAIRKFNGNASVIQVHSLDDLPDKQLRHLFVEARTQDYQVLMSELKKVLSTSELRSSALGRLRRRFQEITAIDFFNSPLRSRVEALLARADDSVAPKPGTGQGRARIKKEYRDQQWITRPRPGIDRVSSAWLIRRFIDGNAKFLFDSNPARHAGAIPFDTFQAGGFGHRGEDCTFETLCKEFGVRDHKVRAIAQIIHDADLEDQKFGRVEGIGLDRALIGWAQQGVGDDELLRRGIEFIEGLYDSLP